MVKAAIVICLAAPLGWFVGWFFDRRRKAETQADIIEDARKRFWQDENVRRTYDAAARAKLGQADS